MKKYFDIYVWTSSSAEDAEKVVKHLNRKHHYISGILDKKHCLKTRSGVSIKDIRIIGNRSQNSIVLVDSNISAFSFQLENGIPIQEFRGNPKDDVLLNLEKLLMEVSKTSNVKNFLRSRLGLRDIISYTSKSFTDEVLSLYLWNIKNFSYFYFYFAGKILNIWCFLESQNNQGQKKLNEKKMSSFPFKELKFHFLGKKQKNLNLLKYNFDCDYYIKRYEVQYVKAMVGLQNQNDKSSSEILHCYEKRNCCLERENKNQF